MSLYFIITIIIILSPTPTRGRRSTTFSSSFKIHTKHSLKKYFLLPWMLDFQIFSFKFTTKYFVNFTIHAVLLYFSIQWYVYACDMKWFVFRILVIPFNNERCSIQFYKLSFKPSKWSFLFGRTQHVTWAWLDDFAAGA